LSHRPRQPQSTVTVQMLIGTLLIDRDFCERLLGDQTSDPLAGFDLTDKERRSVLAAEADSVQELVVELYKRLTAE